MKTAGIVAVSSFALASLVSAAPVNNKRDMVYSTTTEEVWETFWTTTTFWVDPTERFGPAATNSFAGFYEDHGHKHGSAVSSALPIATSTTSSVVVASPSVVKPVAAPAPDVSSSSSTSVFVAPAPTTTSVYVAPAPITTQAPAPVVPTTTAAVEPTTPTTTAAPAANKGSTTTGDHTGDMTYYDVEVGRGSCGTTGSNSSPLVALAAPDMANGANPNANPLCGKTINIYYNGAMKTATIFDTCPSCAQGSIDVTQTLFDEVAPSGDGRVHGVSWSFA